MTQTDLLIIGSGPGGYQAAAYAARQGLRVVIAEERMVGGTCLNCGCIPTKALIHDAAQATGDPAEGARRLEAAIRRKDLLVGNLRAGVEALLSQPGISRVQGHAAFLSPCTIQVGDNVFTANDVIIATGSRAKIPPVEGLTPDEVLANPHVVTSGQLLAQATLPRRLCIVGAGVIGLEMASAFRSLGSEVTVIEYMKECLPAMDQEMARRLRKALEKQGVTFHMGCSLLRVEGDTVTYSNLKKGTAETLQADSILVATGRQANVDALGLTNTPVEVGKHGIVVNDNMLTTCPHVYAIGDANGRQMLAHAATFQGYRAVNHILGRTDHIRLDIMPAAVFTRPEVASVGLTEDLCKQRAMAFTTHKAVYRANGRAQATEAADGLLKLVCDDQGKVIGAHALGQEAAWLVQEMASLMNFDVTLDRLAEIVHIHPTLGEILLDAASH